MLRINYNKVFFGGTMSVKKQIIQGTIVLTSATLLSRILGFLYRIFLSNLMGAKGMGLFQLIFPRKAVKCATQAREPLLPCILWSLFRSISG